MDRPSNVGHCECRWPYRAHVQQYNPLRIGHISSSCLIENPLRIVLQMEHMVILYFVGLEFQFFTGFYTTEKNHGIGREYVSRVHSFFLAITGSD